MTIRRFKDSDYSTISSWYNARNLQPPPQERLPEMGFVVDNVAAGFVYIAEGKLALLEGYITNPTTYAKDRDRALDLLTSALVEASRCPRIFAVTANDAIIRRAKKLGFVVRENRTTVIKELR